MDRQREEVLAAREKALALREAARVAREAGQAELRLELLRLRAEKEEASRYAQATQDGFVSVPARGGCAAEEVLSCRL